MKSKSYLLKNEKFFASRPYKGAGFTLIETLIYAGIISGFLTISLVMVYNLIDFSASLSEQRGLIENQRFLDQKLHWVLSSVSAVNAPAASFTSAVLSVNKIGFAQNPVVVDTLNGVVRLSLGGGTAVALTNGYATTSDLVFENINFSGRNAIRVTATLRNNLATTSLETMIFIKI